MMRRLLIALLFAFPAIAGPHDWTFYPPRIPVIADPQTNTFCASNLACTVTGSWALNAVTTITVSGTGTFTGGIASSGADTTGKWNAIRVVDGVKFTNWATASGDCSSANCLVLIPSSYAGIDCPTVTTNVSTWDFRGSALATPCGNNTDTYLGQTSGVVSAARRNWSVNNPINKSYELTTFIAGYTGTMPASAQSLEGITSVAILNPGTVTIPNAATSLVGIETHANVASTGATLANAYAGVFGSSLLSGSTTNVTTLTGLLVQPNTNAGAGTVTNNYGLLCQQQGTFGTRNFCQYNVSPILLASDATSTGINFEDSALAVHPILTAVSGNNEMRFHPLLDTAGFHFINIANSTDWMFIKSTGVSIPSVGLTVGAGSAITSSGAGGTMTSTIASGTATMTAGAVTAATCQAAITSAATNAAATDSIEWAYATAPTLTTDALLSISPYVTANNVNFTRCNTTNASITGTAIVINWRVLR